jgi:Tfp pilus assembly protein PilO
VKDLEKYKDIIMYLALILVIAIALFKQIQPKFVSTINLFGQVKTQTEMAESISQQLNIAKDKAERKKKLRMLDDMTKKIYQPEGGATDSESNFAFLLDDIIEIARKNHIKTHSIRSTLDPENDVFIKGDKEHYSANRLDMKIISDYTDFQGFLSDLYKYPYLVNFNSIEIYPYSKNKKILLVNLSITIYAMKSADEAKSEENKPENGENNNENNGNNEGGGENPPPP